MGPEMSTAPPDEGSIRNFIKKKKLEASLGLPEDVEPVNTGQQSNSFA